MTDEAMRVLRTNFAAELTRALAEDALKRLQVLGAARR